MVAAFGVPVNLAPAFARGHELEDVVAVEQGAVPTAGSIDGEYLALAAELRLRLRRVPVHVPIGEKGSLRL